MTAARDGRAARLLAHIEAIAGTAPVWGARGSDCTSWPAAWVEQESDAKLELPEYADEAAGRELIAADGLVALWRRVLGDAGIYETSDPQMGDVGVVKMSFGASGCIFGERGTVFVRGRQGAAVIGAGKNTVLAAFAI